MGARKKRRMMAPGGSGAATAERSAKTGVSPSAVLRVFRERQKPLSDREVLSGLGAGKVHRQQVRDILDDLVEEGRLIRIDRAYGLTESMKLFVGRLEIQRSGVGYVIPDDKLRKDLFIAHKDLGDAWHGDRVAAAVPREREGKKHEGRVARILERGQTEFPCRVVKRMGEKLDYRLYSGTAGELLGPQRDAAVQEKLVKLNHEVPTVFPRRTLAEAEKLPEAPGETDLKGRTDLREVPFVTIDGATARDFDDAVHVEKLPRGFRLRVAIADVSHYVAEGSALDREALERGNSYYFPQSVEPMFPERLSNGLCCLNPHVPRLARVAGMTFSARESSGTPLLSGGSFERGPADYPR
jgi:ribonuclease R